MSPLQRTIFISSIALFLAIFSCFIFQASACKSIAQELGIHFELIIIHCDLTAGVCDKPQREWLTSVWA